MEIPPLIARIGESDERRLIAISGIPGSGKTTLAQRLVRELNADIEKAAYIPLDGYHFTRAQLSAMPDPVEAHARRGAAFTFDAEAFLHMVQRLREHSCPNIWVPSFDHARKDPVENEIHIQPHHRVIILEGNYLSLNKGAWREAASLMHELWFIEVDFHVARQRLVARHVAAGLAEDETAAGRRADTNDLVNGREIVDCRLPVNLVLASETIRAV